MDLISLILLAVVLAAGAAFLWRQSKTKGRWGIDLTRKSCPRCGHPLPFIRKPTSSEEAMWGGWTCQKCGAKLDKYGREREAATPPAPS
jgi:hypothetical protein